MLSNLLILANKQEQQYFFNCVPLIMNVNIFHTQRPFLYLCMYVNCLFINAKASSRNGCRTLYLSPGIGPLWVELQTYRPWTCLLFPDYSYTQHTGQRESSSSHRLSLDPAVWLVPWLGSVIWIVKAMAIFRFPVSIKNCFQRCLRASPMFGVEIKKLIINTGPRCL